MHGRPATDHPATTAMKLGGNVYDFSGLPGAQDEQVAPRRRPRTNPASFRPVHMQDQLNGYDGGLRRSLLLRWRIAR